MDPEGGGGAGGRDPPLNNHKYIGFRSNTGPDHTKKSQNYRASIQCWTTISTPAKRHLNGVSLESLYWYLDPPYPHQLKKTLIASKLDPSNKTLWIRACKLTEP